MQKILKSRRSSEPFENMRIFFLALALFVVRRRANFAQLGHDGDLGARKKKNKEALFVALAQAQFLVLACLLLCPPPPLLT